MNNIDNLNVFGYGSLMWKPNFKFTSDQPARLENWQRGFWQGSPDHRGTPNAPGRVLTLRRGDGATTTGRLYTVPKHDADFTLDYLDKREQGGYIRLWITVQTSDDINIRALTYVALPGNPHYLGDAPASAVAHQIRTAQGPSGANLDYYQNFCDALHKYSVSQQEWQGIPDVAARYNSIETPN